MEKRAKKEQQNLGSNTQTPIRNWLKQQALHGNPMVLNWLASKLPSTNSTFAEDAGLYSLSGEDVGIMESIEMKRQEKQLGNPEFIDSLRRIMKGQDMNSRLAGLVNSTSEIQSWFKQETLNGNPLARQWVLHHARRQDTSVYRKWLEEDILQNGSLEDLYWLFQTALQEGHDFVLNLMMDWADTLLAQNMVPMISDWLKEEIQKNQNPRAVLWLQHIERKSREQIKETQRNANSSSAPSTGSPSSCLHQVRSLSQ